MSNPVHSEKHVALDKGIVVSEVDGETIRVYGHGQLHFEEDWFRRSHLSTVKHGLKQAVAQTLSSISFHIESSDVVLSLFEGYDYERTRKFVKETVKATRKRLEKIRQLLAEGQVPEETMDEAADYLIQSVFLPSISVSQDGRAGEGEDLDKIDRIVAFDDELDKQDEEMASIQNWETLPSSSSSSHSHSHRPGLRSGSTPQHSKSGRSHSRLKRPKTSSIDVRLGGLELRYKGYGNESLVPMTVSIDIQALDIIDNIRTSTWNKFLTELRPRDGGVLRPTGSSMVRIRYNSVRDSAWVGGDAGEEANLKARVAPLRLHIDQDALDFIKAFLAFKMDSVTAPSHTPSTTVPTTTTLSRSRGFIQRVEILPIKIKLDYKPKRVDYYQLRKGRTIELMNFFSFEASEMMLRHVIITGISSWTKVGELLEDIWTPDVKANQLVDFLSGINPVRSVVNVGSGVADLILLPLNEYNRGRKKTSQDGGEKENSGGPSEGGTGRVSRGIQKGTRSFAKVTALEAIKLGARLATGTQVILEHAEHVLGGRVPVPGGVGRGETFLFTESQVAEEEQEEKEDRTAVAMAMEEEEEEGDEEEQEQGRYHINRRNEVVSKFSQQPTNVREGIDAAYKSLSGNMRSAAETILAVPMEMYERSNEVKSHPYAILLDCRLAKYVLEIADIVVMI